MKAELDLIRFLWIIIQQLSDGIQYSLNPESLSAVVNKLRNKKYIPGTYWCADPENFPTI